jgi:hypothetical protein
LDHHLFGARRTSYTVNHIFNLKVPIIPVRREEKSYLAKSGWFSSAMNIVGTPWRPVALSWETACKMMQEM